MEKKKILFVNDEMTMGGVARILCTFLKKIDKTKYDVDLLILHKRGELLDEIPNDIKVYEGTNFFNTVDIPFNECSLSNVFSKFRLLFYMKTGLIKNKIQKERNKILKDKHYDIEFSAKEGFCTIFVAYGDSKKKMNWIQTDYKESNYSKNHMNLMKDALKYIDINIACSDKVKSAYKEVFSVENVCVIHNLIDEDRIKTLSTQPCTFSKKKEKLNLVTVARFHKQKGLDRLIRVYSKLKSYYHLVIIGDGELKNELYNEAKSLGCFEDIEWLGILGNPYPIIKESNLFVLSSLYEGFPTITIESLICGTPVLTTRVAGVVEQINNTSGWVVENTEEALYSKLMELKESDEIRIHKESLINYHYDNEKTLNSYYQLFNN